jgi:hypothetical protein
MTIAIDFDGTICYHEFPRIGEPLPNAIESIKKLRQLGHHLILYTMRSGRYLDEAVEWLANYGIVFDEVNANVSQKRWTTSPKIHADVYIDDCSIGCPFMLTDDSRLCVDWERVMVLITDKREIRIHSDMIRK